MCYRNVSKRCEWNDSVDPDQTGLHCLPRLICPKTLHVCIIVVSFIYCCTALGKTMFKMCCFPYEPNREKMGERHFEIFDYPGTEQELSALIRPFTCVD